MMVLSSFLFTFYSSDFSYNTTDTSRASHRKQASLDVDLRRNDLEHRKVITHSLSPGVTRQPAHQHQRIKTRCWLISGERQAHRCDRSRLSPQNFSTVWTGANCQVITDNTRALLKKGQRWLHLLDRLRSFEVCRTLLKTFYDVGPSS